METSLIFQAAYLYKLSQPNYNDEKQHTLSTLSENRCRKLLSDFLIN